VVDPALIQARTGSHDDATVRIACVEVGASSLQTALVDDWGALRFRDGLDLPSGVPVLVASPGLVRGTRVVAASNLGWFDVPVAEALGITSPVELLRNDAEAAALGERALRAGKPELVYVGLGTGVGGAAVSADGVTGNLFGHAPGFGARTCVCTARGCLETVAAGWAMNEPATRRELAEAAIAIARAIRVELIASQQLVVVGGGIARRHPKLVELIAAALPDRTVEPTAAPREAKSAAAWGLLDLHAA
jgi:glucokinase